MHDFLELRLAVGDLVGNRNISDVLPSLTRRAETGLNRRLRTMWQITDFAPAWVDNEATLPPDFLQLVGSDDRLRISGSVITRKPYYTCPAEIEYYAALPTITTSPAGTNWLLTQYPNAYLYAAGVEAAKHLLKADIAMTAQAMLDTEIQAIKIEDDRARYSHRSVRVGGLTP
jgi:hypothetical protein